MQTYHEELQLMTWADDGGMDPETARQMRGTSRSPVPPLTVLPTMVVRTRLGSAILRDASRHDDAWKISAVSLRTLWETNLEYTDAERAAMSRHLTVERFQQLMAEYHTVVAALPGGVLVATGSISAAGYLSRLFVLPEVQRQGVGQRLVERLEGVASARGRRVAHLNASLSAVPFYRRLGYQEGPRVHREGIGASVEMSKVLV